MNFKQWFAFLLLVVFMVTGARLYRVSILKKQVVAPEKLIKPVATMPETDGGYPWTDVPTAFNDSESVNLSSRKIAERHKKVFMSDLPLYVKNVKGAGGYDRESMLKANWMFTVPKEHLADFDLYLKSLGVLDEAMYQDYQVHLAESDDAITGTPHSQRNPPVPQRLLFTGSLVMKGGIQLKGLHFPKGRAMSYYFFKTYITTSVINIRYSHDSGNCFIMEQYMNP